MSWVTSFNELKTVKKMEKKKKNFIAYVTRKVYKSKYKINLQDITRSFAPFQRNFYKKKKRNTIYPKVKKKLLKLSLSLSEWKIFSTIFYY